MKRFLAAAVAVVTAACSASGATAEPPNRDSPTCNRSQWLKGDVGEELGNRGQAVMVASPSRTTAGCSMRFDVQNKPSDIWNNDSFRSILAQYDSQEGWGDNRDVTYGFSFLVPIEKQQTTLPSYSLLWELHHRSEVYAPSPSLAIAPHAIELLPDGRLVYRLAAGPAIWDGTRWVGWTTWMPANTLLSRVATDTWYDVIVRLKFSEEADGLTQVYVRRAGQPMPQAPTWQVRAPNLPWIPGGFDAKVPDTISSSRPEPGTGYTGLYLGVGLYPGGTTWWPRQATQEITLYMAELHRFVDVATAKRNLPNE